MRAVTDFHDDHFAAEQTGVGDADDLHVHGQLAEFLLAADRAHAGLDEDAAAGIAVVHGLVQHAMESADGGIDDDDFEEEKEEEEPLPISFTALLTIALVIGSNKRSSRAKKKMIIMSMTQTQIYVRLESSLGLENLMLLSYSAMSKTYDVGR